MKKILFVFGTRPDAIKCAPVIHEFKRHQAYFQTFTCVTGQHREMLDSVLQFFAIVPDYDLNIMKKNQSVNQVIASSIKKLEKVYSESKPDLVIVQGDANPALAGSLSAYFNSIPIAHLEAGLRSGNLYSPFPEEGNRRIVSQLAALHFVPTQKAKENLNHENITRNVYISGNSVIDALLYTKKRIENDHSLVSEEIKHLVNKHVGKKLVLVTGHRRESFGAPMQELCESLIEIVSTYLDIHIIFPVHLNPNVKSVVNKLLNSISNISLIDPVDYPDMVFLMMNSKIIISDSGGIQEEAPTLGVPIIVTREVTERTEALDSGNALLCKMEKQNIVSAFSRLISDDVQYRKMSLAKNPFGNGTTSKLVLKTVKSYFKL